MRSTCGLIKEKLVDYFFFNICIENLEYKWLPINIVKGSEDRIPFYWLSVRVGHKKSENKSKYLKDQEANRYRWYQQQYSDSERILIQKSPVQGRDGVEGYILLSKILITLANQNKCRIKLWIQPILHPFIYIFKHLTKILIKQLRCRARQSSPN